MFLADIISAPKNVLNYLDLHFLQAFRADLVSGRFQFDELAARESHCSSAQRGGDLGEFGLVLKYN